MHFFKTFLFFVIFMLLSGCSQKELDIVKGKMKTGLLTLWETQTYTLPDNDAVYSPEQPVLLIVLDASSSMNARDKNNIVKIAAAKEVISDVVGQVDINKTNIGLIAFNQGCGSARLYVEPTNNNPYKVNAVVQNMKASGGTPLAESIRKAGDVLSRTNQKVNVLIVSDGEESCSGDPVYEAQQLMATYGVEPTMYVVGYNVDRKSRNQLEAIARVGKGKYFDVQDSIALGKMMNQIVSGAHMKSSNFSDDGLIYKFNINFTTSSDVIESQYVDEVIALAKYLYVNGYGASIEGHTDNVGGREYNKQLSEKRAKAVAQKLVDLGVDPQRLSYIGFGDAHSIASNLTETGRYKNRRVEAHINKGN